MPLADRLVHRSQKVLEVLTLQISQRLHCRALHLLHIALHRADLIVHGSHAAHQLVKPVIVIGRNLLEQIVKTVDLVVDDLHAVVQVCELILLGLDVCSEDVFDHLRDVGVNGLVLLLGALEPVSVDAGWGLDFSLVAVVWFLVLLLLLLLLALVGILFPGTGLFARVSICGRDNEFLDLEGVGVLGGGGGNTEMVAFGELDLCTWLGYEWE